MKIGEVKLLICQQGLSDQLMTEFLRSLRRVPGMWLRAQHCFLLGEEIGGTDYPGAVQLISYGLKHFAQNAMTRRLGYEHLARVHRANLSFDAARDCYQAAKRLLAVERGQDGSTAAQLVALESLRNELERTDFGWSAELTAYCSEVDPDEEVLLALRDCALTLAIAQYIIAEHCGDAAGMETASRRMRQLLNDEECSGMEQMFRWHRVDPRVSLTEGEAAFLRRIGVI